MSRAIEAGLMPIAVMMVVLALVLAVSALIELVDLWKQHRRRRRRGVPSRTLYPDIEL